NKQLSLKLDYLFPGASFKDRGATVLISKLKEWGIRSLVEDSSGNAGASIASYAARAGMETHLFVARSTREAKKLHIRSMGAVLHEIEGDRQAVADAAIHFAHKHYDASHVRNPLFIHGTKTFAYELWEQCAGALPAHIFFPTGNGSLLLGAFT